MEILEYFKTRDNVDYLIRFQSEFNKQPYIYPIVKRLIEKQDEISKILDPKYKNLRLRVACPCCGLADKNSLTTKFKNETIYSICPTHGEYKANIRSESDKLEYNTPVRNLVRAIAYGMHNNDENQNYQIMRITGSDYAGFYQEELLYVKEGAYSDLPSYLINYEYLKNSKGIEALDVIHNITDDWIEKNIFII